MFEPKPKLTRRQSPDFDWNSQFISQPNSAAKTIIGIILIFHGEQNCYCLEQLCME